MTSAEAGSRTVRAGDAAFSYLDAGSSPPLVLLHGIGSAAGSFRCQVETLSPRLRVIAWDAPGLWRLDTACDRTSACEPLCAALDRWLGALGIDRCHMLGHSLGTLIAARGGAADAGDQLDTRQHRQRARTASARRTTAVSGAAP